MNTFPARTRAKQAVLAAMALSVGALASGKAIAGGIILYEVGTEDVGLAAAGYAARAQDASTVLTNPAGMVRLDGTRVQLGTQLLYSDLKFSNSGASSPALGNNSSGKFIGDNGWFPGGGLFLSYSVSPDLKLGLAATSTFGSVLDYNDNWAGRYYVQQATLIGASLLPSIAFRVTDKLSLGASVNAMYGYLKNETGIKNLFSANDGKLSMSDGTWGWGGNLGLMYEATPDTRFGLTYSSQVKLDFEPQARFSGTGPVLTALLDARGLNRATLNLGITVPQQVMGSVFHTVNDRLALLGNVGWQQWSKFGDVEVGVEDTNNPTSLTTNLKFKDTWHAAVGAQYRISEPWRLNLGIAYDSAFQSGNVSPMLPTNQGWRFGIGGQNQVDKTFGWGLAAEYIYGGTGDVNKQALLPVDTGGRGNLVGSYDNIGILYMSANFNWKF
ncbi:MAG: outer membrane protein transport protein [Candidatus Accumulibacter sp.]|uniref:Outer membrane protein transport protein n=1 Tax=Candidatus Accumulibacter proximus TaxID=2954385 RepID=A0A935Q0X6_9PROT|nr:outer membrane protein transport protein [Candidatus Accumulibacter proximus]